MSTRKDELMAGAAALVRARKSWEQANEVLSAARTAHSNAQLHVARAEDKLRDFVGQNQRIVAVRADDRVVLVEYVDEKRVLVRVEPLL